MLDSWCVFVVWMAAGSISAISGGGGLSGRRDKSPPPDISVVGGWGVRPHPKRRHRRGSNKRRPACTRNIFGCFGGQRYYERGRWLGLFPPPLCAAHPGLPWGYEPNLGFSRLAPPSRLRQHEAHTVCDSCCRRRACHVDHPCPPQLFWLNSSRGAPQRAHDCDMIVPCETPTKPAQRAQTGDSASRSPMEVSLSEESFCSLAKRVPAARRTGSLIDDNAAEQNRRSFQIIIDTLARQPDLIPAMHGSLMQLLSSKGTADNETAWGTISTLGKLDAGFCAEFVCSFSKLGAENLASMRSADPKIVHTLMSFALQLPLSCNLPAPLKDKRLCRAVLASRHKVCGARLANLGPQCVAADGSFSWAHGCFRFEFKEGRAVRIRHVSGEEVQLPDHIVINQNFAIEQNYDDAKAAAVYEGATFNCKSFFAAGTGPHSYTAWKQKGKLVAEMVDAELAELEKQRVQSGALVQVAPEELTKVMGDVTKKKRAAAAEKARGVAMQRMEQVKKSRRVVLTT